jgi:hypothetical protein
MSNSKSSKKTGHLYKTITISSPEAMEQDTRNYSASLTPEERIAYLLELNQIAFAEVFEKYSEEELWDRQIKFEQGNGNDHSL